jgi:aryl-alcohol dehydrogenase-like predicted oxidoreductase
MRVQQLGPFADISRLTLGGGGLGQLWGETSPEEARATVHAALDAGINLIDTAPSYRLCEQVIAETCAGALPAGVRITTKCLLGEPAAGTAAQVLEASLDASLAAMGLDGTVKANSILAFDAVRRGGAPLFLLTNPRRLEWDSTPEKPYTHLL